VCCSGSGSRGRVREDDVELEGEGGVWSMSGGEGGRGDVGGVDGGLVRVDHEGGVVSCGE
jgi:hypothetical protein